MSEITYKGMTAAQYRAAAKRSRERVVQSRDSSDTDGFMTQWAGDITARMYELQAELLDDGGTAEFPALFDVHGNLLAAKLVSVYDSYSHTHVSKWAILKSDDPDSEIVKWVKLSEASDEERRIANNAKKGYYEGIVIAPAAAEMIGANKTSVSVTVKRTDGGFSRDVQIVDSGKLPEVRKLRAQAKADQQKRDVASMREQSQAIYDKMTLAQLRQRMQDRKFDAKGLRKSQMIAALVSDRMQAIDDLARAELSKTAKGRELLKSLESSQTPPETSKRATRTKSATKRENAPAASSRAVNTSHANCAHESTKAARAKCRRERAQK